VRNNRRHVAIIGGGYAAMAAAWDLTARDNKERCDVTVFQMGGRLGGKGASSRNEKFGNRIEEHGLHLWLGYYENAFRTVRTCFAELQNVQTPDAELRKHLALDRPPSERPFDNWNWLTAFERASLVGLADNVDGDWVPWVARFPEYVLDKDNETHSRCRWDDGTILPGVHIVTDEHRAYPGQEPFKKAKDCDDGEDECLERPNVAFFLTHALRELQAFIESLESRLENVIDRALEPLTIDPDNLMSRAMSADPHAPTRPGDRRPPDPLRALRIARLTLLIPALEAFANVARIAESPVPFVGGPFVAMLDRYIDSMRDRIEFFVQTDAAARRIWELIDLLAANIRGLIVAGLRGEDDFSSLDEWNYIDWLRMNRISERTLRNPIIRGAHDLGFAYRAGNSREPRIAAGQAINAGCHFFFMYKGALFWRMKAGMGDVVFAPMYLALRDRGVKFRFFHRLDNIGLDRDTKTVTRLEFLRQVKLKTNRRDAPTNYEPLVRVEGKNGRTISAWGSSFDANQIAHNVEDLPRMLDFESIWCDSAHGDHVYATVGQQRNGDNDSNCVGDFDTVVVTVPIAALRRVSKELAAADENWRNMLDNIRTVATQAMQLWVDRPTYELGWSHGQVSFSAFVHPFDTWADLSQLTEVEKQDDAEGAHYFCSVLADAQLPGPLSVPVQPDEDVAPRDRVRPDDLNAARELVKENARRFLDDWIFQLWPDAADRYPNAFKWDFLVGGKNGNAVDPLDTQYIVANVDPSQRYTQSLPGTTQYRIAPGETGFGRLVIAGDWTECGLNFGCVEAAVISGRLASAAITGFPDTRFIPGYAKRMRRAAATQGG
jgi:uncharacterized protein with NAD-binding domain and iron-sulfur cluster